MLYKNAVADTEKTEFIFEAKPYNQDIDEKEIAAIEVFYTKNGYIPEAYIPQFLNWLTYKARINITHPLSSVMDASMAGACARAQSYYDAMLTKLGLNHITFNIGAVLGTEPIHALTCVEIPTRINGEDSHKLYMLDPTFRQFCIAEENRYERYNEDARWSVRMSTPHPGYFFNLTDKGKRFAEGLIHYGYYEVNEDSLKTYFDPFALYTTPKEAYENSDDVGKVSSTTFSGSDYWNRITSNICEPLTADNKYDLSTPRENIERERNKLSSKIKRVFQRQELDDMFVIEDSSSKTNSSTK